MRGAPIHAVVDGRTAPATARAPLADEEWVCGSCVHVGREARRAGRVRGTPDPDWNRTPLASDAGMAIHLERTRRAIATARACRGILTDVFLAAVLTSPRQGASPLPPKGSRLGAVAATCIAQGGACAYCRAALRPGLATIDHDVPTIRGGTDLPRNLVWACEPCNTLKSFLTGDEFRRLLRDERPPAVPTILDAQERLRTALDLDLSAVVAARSRIDRDARWNEGSGWRRDWRVGDEVWQWDETPERGAFRCDRGFVSRSDARPGGGAGLAEIRTWGRTLRVYTQTFRERGLTFAQTLGNRRRWLPEAMVEAMGPDRIAGVMGNGAKRDYLESFLQETP